MGKIKNKDLKKLEKIGKDLQKLIDDVRLYVHDASIYVQDEGFSIHYDQGEKNGEPFAKSEGHASVNYLDCGGGFNDTEFID